MKDGGWGAPAALIMKTETTSPTQRIRDEEFRALLLEEIEKLPTHYRLVIERDLVNDGSAKDEEFAARMGIQPATVWTRRHRAIKMLRDRLMARLNPPQPLPRVPQPLPRVAESTSSSSSSSSPPA